MFKITKISFFVLCALGFQPILESALARTKNSEIHDAGFDSKQGPRDEMQDTELCEIFGDQAYFAVFDGHSSNHYHFKSALVAQEVFKECIETSISLTLIRGSLAPSSGCGKFSGRDVLSEAFKLTESKLRQTKVVDGTCAVAVLKQGSILTIANAGDSRFVVQLEDDIKETVDHKPDLPSERERIEAAGGRVEQEVLQDVGGIMGPIGPMRVMGDLSTSRALGDFSLKMPMAVWRHRGVTDDLVSSKPDISIIDLEKTPVKVFILACDGIWDVISSQEAIKHVNDCFAHGLNAKQAAAFLVEIALRKGSTDNCTVIVVRFKNHPSLEIVAPVIPVVPDAPKQKCKFICGCW